MMSRCGGCRRCCTTRTGPRMTGARLSATSTTTVAPPFVPADLAVVRACIHPIALTVTLYSAARVGTVALQRPPAMERTVTAALNPAPEGVTVTDALGMATPLSLFTLPVSVYDWAAWPRA